MSGDDRLIAAMPITGRHVGQLIDDPALLAIIDQVDRHAGLHATEIKAIAWLHRRLRRREQPLRVRLRRWLRMCARKARRRFKSAV